ncbi:MULTISPECIES: hypothetical protein [Yersinia]|nr:MULTISPECIES: hypothetical protein [Yersinia]AYX13058.1 hypothetical protein EGX52_21090 [Yersinia pseudotuberculosis]HDL7925840.1 hypothetical protein [Yersinia enterocolitica]
MGIQTVYRCRIDFDVYDPNDNMNKDQSDIKKITDFIHKQAGLFGLDECLTSDGGPAHGPYCVIEGAKYIVIEAAESKIIKYIKKFKHHSIELVEGNADAE